MYTHISTKLLHVLSNLLPTSLAHEKDTKIQNKNLIKTNHIW